MKTNSLSWALVIATYKREYILPRCLRLAAKQTRLPKEIIVVDGSPEWEKTRDIIQEEFSRNFGQINLQYLKANRLSLPSQRNQGIKASSADILFLIDDDSLMYPDCAEEIMKIYEADIEEAIKGVSAIPLVEPPDNESFPSTNGIKVAVKPQQTVFRRWLKSLLSVEQTFFLPYDKDYPCRPIPDHLYNLNIGRIDVMAGFAMTFRRNILLVEKFSEVLERYAAGEDQDLSYRVSRYGAIVNAINAYLCHLEISGGRLSKYTVTILASLNPAVLQQFYSDNKQRSQKDWRKLLQRRLLINFFRDISNKNYHFPKTRGVLFALSQLNIIYSKTPEELLKFYPEYQEQLIQKNQR